MRRHLDLFSLCFATAAMVVVPAVATAGVSNMALAPDGTVFSVTQVNDHLEILVDEGGEVVQRIPVPQTTGIEASALSIVQTPVASTLVVLWQESLGDGLSRVMMASWNDDTWLGPIVIAGDDGMGSAANPTMMVDRLRVTAVEDDEEVVVEQTAIHLLWWYRVGDEAGWAEWASVWLNDLGVPMIEELNPLPLHGILPYGVGCELDDQPIASLAHPHFFRDPMTGDVHMLVADLEDCVFHVLRLTGELSEDDSDSSEDPDGDEPTVDRKRRRMVIVLGFSRDIAISPAIRLEAAQFEVGYDLSVVTYWDDVVVDDEDATETAVIRYVTMHESGWSEVKTLPIGDRLSHEEGVGLIRKLASQPR
jgi:hypothetical protein